MKERKQKKKWIRRRHGVVRNLLYAVMYPYCRLRYGIRVEPFREKEKRPYLILLNHQTPFDQFFAGISFKGAVYYLATEDIFSLGWISDLIRWLIAPIPIRKQTTDISAVMTCIRVAREGGSVCIAPEGNRTYSGRTGYMNPAIAGLARKMGLPIALYRIEGGYGAQPRWSDGVRKGRMRSYVARIIEPEEYKALSNEELLAAIEEGLFVDEANADGCFRSKRRAEYLERAIYVCPFCGFAKWESRGAAFTCTSCGKTVYYGEDKRLMGDGFDFPFPFVGQWYDYQENFINSLDVTVLTSTPIFRDEANLSEVIIYERKELLRENAKIALYGDRIVIDENTENELVFPFAQTDAVTVLGRNKLNIYQGKQVYQLKGGKRFNALKYVHIYHRHKNITRGDANGKFLGL